ncbi:MAG: ParB N-terminal domain-containing protein, partial [Thermoleophilia bacterium]|nr:ParB N-terminal domain-containing protein [Thermoleophilia bacterium]
MTQMDEAGRPRRSIPVARIDDSGRLRPVDPDKVAQIARSMAEVGLRNPIEVRAAGGADDGWLLVAGAHRLAAARSLGLSSIEALIFTGTADEARLAEIDENLFRHELNPLDEAVFLAERAAIYLRLHPQTGVGRAPKSKVAKLATFQKARKFSDDVAERTGISARTVRRALTRFNRLTDEARAVIR